MVRTFKDDIILGYRVKYIDAGYGMIFAQVPKITTQYMGNGINKTAARKSVTKSLQQYIAHTQKTDPTQVVFTRKADASAVAKLKGGNSRVYSVKGGYKITKR
jgi:hypothetical protein